MITMELYELKNICMEMAALGVANYIKKTSPANDELSQREAYLLYGEARVKSWVRDDLLNTHRIGGSKNSKIIYYRSELEGVEVAIKLKGIVNK